MTKKEFYVAIAALEGNEELAAFAELELEKLSKVAESKRGKENAKSMEFNAEVETLISELSAGTKYFASDFAAERTLSTQKASSILRRAVDLGLMTSEEVKVSSKGPMKQYEKVDKA